MKFRSRYILSAVTAVLLFATTVPAQNLPALKRHGRYHVGTLKSGVPYVLATNAVEKGLADFALICDSLAAPDPGALLEELPHFPKGSPARFLAEHGAGLGTNGYVNYRGDCLAFQFSGLRVSDPMARDSMFLLLFDLILSTPGGNHAIVAAGDLDPNSSKTALELLSMMLEPTKEQTFAGEAGWKTVDTATLVRQDLLPGQNPFAEVVYRLPRIPRRQLNTVVPYVSVVYANALGDILYRRLRTVCLAEHVPYGAIDTRYRSSADSPWDEKFTVRVATDSAHIDRMVELLGETLSALDRQGAFTDEYKDATGAIHNFVRRRGRMMANAYFMEKGLGYFLYGTDLGSEVEVSKFLTSRDMTAEEECRLFNAYTAALIDSAANMTLRVGGSDDPDPMAHFLYGWNRRDGYVHTYVNNKNDALNLNVQPVKAKVKKVAPEPVSGGELWSFANGVDVVFKQTKGDPGNFHFGWLLRGGYPLVPDLADGEGAFVGDMLRIGYVGPLQGLDFYNMLRARGIEMEPNVGMQDLRLTGRCPSGELELLLKSFLELSRNRKPDPNAFETYRENQILLAAEADPVRARMWELLWPADRYTPWKNVASLSDDLPEKAERYFAERFSRCNDGVIVLVGDLDPVKAKKLLEQYMGAFVTSPVRTTAVRIPSRPRTGTLTVFREGETPGSHMLLRIPLLYTAKNVYASELACLYLEDCLDAVLVESGLRYHIEHEFHSYPEGAFQLRIDAWAAEAYAVPKGVEPADPVSAVTALRKALERAAEKPVPDKLLAAYKTRLQETLKDSLTGEESLVEAVLKRFGEGKDLVTTYKQRIDEVSVKDLTTILEDLHSGARVEYIVK